MDEERRAAMEKTWLACADSCKMLDFFRDDPPDRKMLLYAAACYARVRSLLTPAEVGALEQCINVADEDRKPSPDTKLSILHAMGRHPQMWNPKMGTYFIAKFTADATARLFASRSDPARRQVNEDDLGIERDHQASLLREIAGNPFRPVSVDPSWPTKTVAALAQAIYDSRAFDRLPILADALEETGCTDEEILSHCRGPGPHVRGCWVVDLLLGKE